MSVFAASLTFLTFRFFLFLLVVVDDKIYESRLFSLESCILFQYLLSIFFSSSQLLQCSSVENTTQQIGSFIASVRSHSKEDLLLEIVYNFLSEAWPRELLSIFLEAYHLMHHASSGFEVFFLFDLCLPPPNPSRILIFLVGQLMG